MVGGGRSRASRGKLNRFRVRIPLRQFSATPSKFPTFLHVAVRGLGPRLTSRRLAYDCGLHGLAQRYLIQALRQAIAAGDRGLSAEILAAMSAMAACHAPPRHAA